MSSRARPLLALLVAALGVSCVAPTATPDRPWRLPGKDDGAASVGYLEDIEQVEQIVAEIVDYSYPELASEDLWVAERSFPSGSTLMMRCRPSFRAAVDGDPATNYIVEVNERAFELGTIPLDAAVSVLAHEIAHALFYATGEGEHGEHALVHAAVSRIHGPTQARFERRTDLITIQRGYGAGLATYRDWIFAQLEGEELEDKRRVYLSREEIEAIVAASRIHPQLMDRWLENPPLSLADIEEDARNADDDAAIQREFECAQWADPDALFGDSRLCAGDEHWYSVTLEDAEPHIVTLRYDGNLVDVEMEVYDPESGEHLEEALNTVGLYADTALVEGSVLVRVFAIEAEGEDAFYSLEVD